MDEYLKKIRGSVKSYFKKNRIPDYFYECFFGELIKIFGFNIFQDLTFSNNEIKKFKQDLELSLTNFEGSSGWNLALKQTCFMCHLKYIYFDYNKSNWIWSDYFDERLCKKMIDIIFDDDCKNSYYSYIFKKFTEKEKEEAGIKPDVVRKIMTCDNCIHNKVCEQDVLLISDFCSDFINKNILNKE